MTGPTLSRYQGRQPTNAETQVAARYVTPNIQQTRGVSIHEALDDLLIYIIIIIMRRSACISRKDKIRNNVVNLLASVFGI
jgi:hypothetical protein